MWEIIRVVRHTRAAERDLPEPELLALVEDNTGVAGRQLRTALEYRGAYPAEVDALVDQADRVEAERLAAQARAEGLLGG